MSKPLAAIDRPLTLRLRADLLSVPVEMAGETTWVINDPLTLEHFHFSAEEFALMGWLRRPVAIAELQRLFNRRFSPQTITPEAIWDFLQRLHSAGLLISDAEGQGEELLQRQQKDRNRRWALSWTGLLGMRFRGVDPDAFLTLVHICCRWLFSPVLLIAALGVVMYAVSIVVGHFAEFHSRLPELSALVDRRNVLWLLLAIGIVKVLHELGHALTCKHFGGEVHELGFMLLVFAPCLYCDVSDAWRMPSKWRRIAISAAGIGVELFLAAVATIVWWHAQPGVVQLVALNIMIVCTVNTLVMNGNPLMRYDGYYVLSDLVETPNLWERSREALRRLFSNFLVLIPPPDDPLVPTRHRIPLVLYAAASKIYLMIICVAIVWGLTKVLYPHHLENVAFAIGFVVLGAALVTPLTGAMQLARNPIRRAEVRKDRVALLMAAVAAAFAGALSIPVNYDVTAPLVLLPEDAARVYATVEGTLASTLPPGSKVRRGEEIGRLENTDTQLELARLEGEEHMRQLHVDHLARLRGVDTEANDKLPTANAALVDSQRRLVERRNEAKRLLLDSPIDGVVIPAPRIESKAGNAHPAQLPTWSRSLLDERSRGAHVSAGTLVCLVGDPTRLAAVLLVDDTNVKRLKPGQKARLKIDQLPGEVLEGEVVEVARHDVSEGDNAAANQANLAPLMRGIVPPGQSGTYYEARVRFSNRSETGRGSRVEGREPEADASAPTTLNPLIIGGRGEAKVFVERITLARRIWRWFAQTFRLPM
jgi:putative peptide zinc metalloprotease protein